MTRWRGTSLGVHYYAVRRETAIAASIAGVSAYEGVIKAEFEFEVWTAVYAHLNGLTFNESQLLHKTEANTKITLCSGER